MTQVVLTEAAQTDLETAAAYLREYASPSVADRFLMAFEELASSLGRFPEMAPRLYKEVRRALMPTFSFGVFYSIDEDVLVVLRVLHMAQSPEQWPRR